MSDAIDTTAEDLDSRLADEDTVRAIAAPARPAALAVTPNVGAGELVARLDVIRQAMETAMKEGVDYGRIPGVDKPTLFKPGAEKLGVLFQLDVQLTSTKTWGPGEHLTVETKATVFHAPTGTRLGFGEGLATTREKKHAKRKQERTCPSCGMPAVIAGKAEYGGGWLCWKKRDGCGAKFSAGDPAIEDQDVGTVENPELPDAWNNVVKMAAKRARVDAVLAVTGASALFTQDAEDIGAPPEPDSLGRKFEAITDRPIAVGYGTAVGNRVRDERTKPPVPEYVREVKRLVRQQKVTTSGVRTQLRSAGVDVGDRENPVPLVDALTEEQAVPILEWLRRPVSDVPGAEGGEFTHPPADADELFSPEAPS